jgi:rubrerythrin
MESQTDRKSLSHLMKDAAIHAKLCAVALATPTHGQEVIDIKLFLCPECAHIESDRPPALCPICGTQAEEFIAA